MENKALGLVRVSGINVRCRVRVAICGNVKFRVRGRVGVALT